MHFGNSNFKQKNEKTANPTKTYVPKILRTQNCCRKFIKNLLPGKRKENM